MSRDEFLKKHWLRYPPETGAIQDCAGFLAGLAMAQGTSLDEQWVGGRLKAGSRSGFDLASGGSSFSIDFDEAEWSTDCVRGTPPAFSVADMREGDLVSVKTVGRPPHTRARIVRLLFAVNDPTWKKGPSAPFSTEFELESGVRWQLFTRLTREFFVSRGFLEARTPTLVSSPGTEPFLDPFVTHAAYGAKSKSVFLPTSPEFHLKKLLCMDATKIFELKDCFRNNEGGSHHQPEFLMLEWYRAYCGLEPILEDAKALIASLWKALGRGDALVFRTKTMAELFSSELSFELKPTTDRTELLALARKHGVSVSGDDSWDDIFFRLFIERIESRVLSRGVWIIRDYPPSQAALARINSGGWADRFEVYWNGLEIANAFHELNDPEANRERFLKDADVRAELGKPPVVHDEELVNALYVGMPPSGGIALGMDRLFMAITGITEIEKTRAFPHRV